MAVSTNTRMAPPISRWQKALRFSAVASLLLLVMGLLQVSEALPRGVLLLLILLYLIVLAGLAGVPKLYALRIARFLGAFLGSITALASWLFFDVSPGVFLGVLCFAVIQFLVVVAAYKTPRPSEPLAGAQTAKNSVTTVRRKSTIGATLGFLAGILLVSSALILPGLLRSRMAANEATAASALRTIGTANITHSATYNVGFAGTLAALGPDQGGAAASITASDLLDSLLSGLNPPATEPVKYGYKFTYKAPHAVPTQQVPNLTFSVVATPVGPGSSGTSTFCMDQDNVVIRDVSGTLVAADATGCAATWPIGITVNRM